MGDYLIARIQKHWPLYKWLFWVGVEKASYFVILYGLITFVITKAHTISHVEAESIINMGLVLFLVAQNMRKK